MPDLVTNEIEDAAYEAWMGSGSDVRDSVREMLDAVAPLIAAKALREMAEALVADVEGFDLDSETQLSYYNCTHMDADALRNRARDLERGQS